MDPVNIEREVDEVWLGMDLAVMAFRRDGHSANEDQTACASCYALYRLEVAREVYRARNGLETGG